MGKYESMLTPFKRIVDEDAYSIRELSNLLLVNCSQAGRIARDKVEAGEWQQVYKSASSGNWKYVKAYRPRRKGKNGG